MMFILLILVAILATMVYRPRLLYRPGVYTKTLSNRLEKAWGHFKRGYKGE